VIFNGDCLDILATFESESVDMIYLDPPFFTQKTQKLSDKNGKIYKFKDTWSSRKEYLAFMKARILSMKKLLKPTGSLFLHCDTSASWHLKILLDEIFGETNFRSEIIWCYKRWSNSQNGLLPNHQTIFLYSKTKNFKFNTIYGDYSPTTNIDQILQERERDKFGKAVYKKNSNGEIVSGKAKKGVPLSDVWEIPFLNPKAKERTGYPTQKPVELLERIIKISTDKGDLVLDPFCGSGTTLVSAKLLGRKFVGIDISKDAVEMAQKRLITPFKTDSTLLRVGVDSYKTKTERELKILSQFECDIVQRNRGIDAFLKKHYLGLPVALKIQKENETILEAINLLQNAGEKKKCSFTVLIYSKNENSMFLADEISVPKNMILLPVLDENLNFELQKRSAVSPF